MFFVESNKTKLTAWILPKFQAALTESGPWHALLGAGCFCKGFQDDHATKTPKFRMKTYRRTNIAETKASTQTQRSGCAILRFCSSNLDYPIKTRPNLGTSAGSKVRPVALLVEPFDVRKMDEAGCCQKSKLIWRTIQSKVPSFFQNQCSELSWTHWHQTEGIDACPEEGKGADNAMALEAKCTNDACNCQTCPGDVQRQQKNNWMKRRSQTSNAGLHLS